MARLNQILAVNSFPQHLINKLINDKMNNSQPNTTEDSDNHTHRNLVYSSIHYIPGMSEYINEQLDFDRNRMKLTYKPTNTMRKSLYTKTKQKINTVQKSGVVYKMVCQDCNKCYIGQTSKKLEDRLKRHKYDYKNRHSLEAKTAAVTHSIDHGHSFNFDQVTILQSEPIKFKREIKESSNIYIHSASDVNKKTDLNNLNQEYHNSLNTFANVSKLSPLKKRANLV